jgi:PAS domain S-box-containing protein
MDRPAVRLQLIQGTVSEIVSNTYVTRITLDDETVWFRTSRAGRPPIETGDSVAVVAGTIGPERILIAIQIRRLRDARSFRPHMHSSTALRVAASVLLRAHTALGERGLSIAGAAVGPLASLGTGYLQAQIDIVARHLALVASQVQVQSAAKADVGGAAAARPSSEVSIGLQGAAPTTESPWWHSELLEYTHDAIIIWEMDGAGILYWNQAAEQLYGYTREQARGKVTHDLLRTVTRKPVKELESMLARYGVWIGEMRHTTRDGRIVEVEGRLSLMSQRSGKWLVLEVNRDVTDRRYAEAAGAAREASLSNLHRER